MLLTRYGFSAAKRLRCVLGMFNSLEVEVLSQPDGGEG